MKLILPVILAFSSFAIAKPQVIDYPMRNISKNDPRFAKIFKAIRSCMFDGSVPVPKAPVNSMASRGFGMDAPKKTEPAAVELTRLDIGDPIRIKQTVATGEFIVDYRDTSYHIVISGATYADGTVLRGKLEPTGEFYTYTNVLGARITLKKCAFNPNRNFAMTEDDFIERLRVGESFVIRFGTVLAKCETCSGWGRVGGQKVGAPKIECTPCHGSGERNTDRIIRLVW